MKKIFTAVILTIIVASVKLFAAGASSAIVLSEDVFGRTSALGEAFTAGSGDIASLFYNPAGLRGLKKQNNLGLNYSTRLIDSNLGAFVFAFSGPKDAFAICYTYLDTGKDTFSFSDGSSFTRTSLSEMVLQTAYSYKIARKFSGGVSMKFFSSMLVEQYYASAFAADAGFLYEGLLNHISLGAALRNAGQGIKYARQTESLPEQYRAGVKYSNIFVKSDKNFEMYSTRYILNMSILADWVKNLGDEQEIHGGLDLDFGLFSLRAGNKWINGSSSPSFGLGFQDKGFSLDYSYSFRRDITPVQTASITYGW